MAVNEITPVQQAIKQIIETIKKIPQNIVSPDNIGTKQFVSESNLPLVMISIKDVKELSSGIGDLIEIQTESKDRICEIKGSRISGIFQINVWDLSTDKIEEVVTAITETITENKNDLKRNGFLYLSLIGEAYPFKLSAYPLKEAMIGTIEYQLVFESINRKICPEKTIKEIKVNIDHFFDENMIIKR